MDIRPHNFFIKQQIVQIQPTTTTPTGVLDCSVAVTCYHIEREYWPSASRTNAFPNYPQILTKFLRHFAKLSHGNGIIGQRTSQDDHAPLIPHSTYIIRLLICVPGKQRWDQSRVSCGSFPKVQSFSRNWPRYPAKTNTLRGPFLLSEHALRLLIRDPIVKCLLVELSPKSTSKVNIRGPPPSDGFQNLYRRAPRR